MHTNDVAKVDINWTQDVRFANELDASRAVHEIQEHELAQITPRHDSAGKATVLLFEHAAGLQRLGLSPDRCYLIPVRETSWESHDRASLKSEFGRNRGAAEDFGRLITRL